jgi:hypothetical protein
MSTSPPNPYLATELAGLTPGTALDAGCGADAGHGPDRGHDHGHARGQLPPPEASVTAADVAARLGTVDWQVVTADERHRTLGGDRPGPADLYDVVVRAVRR